MSTKLLKTHILHAKRQERVSSLRSWFVLHENIWQQGEEGDPSTMLCTGEATPGAVSSAELPSTRHSWTLRREPSEGPTRGLRVWRPWCIRKCWESLSPRRRLRGGLINMHKYVKKGWKEVRDRFFAVVPSDRTRGSRCNWNTEGSFWTSRKPFYCDSD